MIHKTKDYEKFNFIEGNRFKINHGHVRNLVNSIKQRNLLQYRPIEVDSSFGIIDGQHRLLAAKALGVDIYYEIKKDLTINEVIALNNSRPWGIADYLHFYVTKGFVEYIKLKDFCEKNNINISVALSLTIGRALDGRVNFREGRYVFPEDKLNVDINFIHETISVIKRKNTYSAYVNSPRFWNGLARLFNHPDFIEYRWFSNLEKLCGRIGPCVSLNDYTKMFQDIYNYHQREKIEVI